MGVLERLKEYYDCFKGEKGYIGFTEKGEPIPFFKVEKSEFPRIIIQYSIHAREYITTYLSLLQIEDFIKDGKKGCVYFIPAVNIDGIKICLSGNPLYKANANMVDLNVNFDARWGSGEKNTLKRGTENFIGEYPFSERETKALRDFTLTVRPHLTVSYHAKGREIYYDFFQEKERLVRDFCFAKAVERATGYKIVENLNSAGGYKDWCVEELKIPSLTVEVGSDDLTHPISVDNLDGIYKENKEVIKEIIRAFSVKKWKRNLCYRHYHLPKEREKRTKSR